MCCRRFMTTVLLTSFSIGRMVRCDPSPPSLSLFLPAALSHAPLYRSASASLRPGRAPLCSRSSLLNVVTALRLHRSPPPHPALSALRRRLSPTTPLPVSATLRPRRSPSAPLRGSPSAPLSVCAALRYLRSPYSLLSFLANLRLRRSPSSPLFFLAALLPRRSPSSQRSPFSQRSVRPLARRSRHLHAAAARSRRSALLTPVPRPPQVEIMPCSNHITGISTANVLKVSNVTRGTLKQTLEI